MRHLFSKNYVRIYLWIGMIFTMIIIPFSMFLANQFSKYAYSQMDLFNRDTMLQTASRTEFLLNKLKAYGLHMYQDSTVQEWLQSSGRSPLDDMDALHALTNYMSTEPFIKRAYLVNVHKEQAIDSLKGLVSFEKFGDAAMLKKIREDRPLFLQFFYHETGGEPYLALIVPSTPARKDHRGYLVLLLDNRALQENLLGLNKEPGMDLMIVDGQGRNVLGTTENDAAILNELRRLKPANSETQVMTVRGMQLFVNSAPLASQKWTVYSLTELKAFKRQAQAFQTKIVGYSLLLLVLLLLAAFWNSRRMVKPFRRLADQLQRRIVQESRHSALALPAAGDEYSILKSGIELLSSRVDEMHQSLRGHSGLLKAEYLRQWLLQGRMNRTLREGIARESELLASDLIRLAVVKIDAYRDVAETYDFASRQLLKYAMGNIAGEIISGEGGALETIDLASDHIVFLIGLDRDDAEVRKLLETIKGHIATYVRLQVTIAVSDLKHLEDDLRSVYDFVLELTLLKFISGEDKVYTEGDYESYVRLLQPLSDPKSLDKLLVAVKSGKKDQVVLLLEELFGQMAAVKYSECKVRLTVILFTIMKEFDKLRALQGVDGIDKQLDRFSTLQEARHWLEAELFAVMDQLGSRKGGDRKEKLAEEMINYVLYHIHDPMLSVEAIAEHVSLSAKYARSIFQEVRGVSLSNYILNTRIEKVKELLVTTTMSVADIGERSGFLTRSHYFTAFKKATGLTPNQYRLHHTEGEGGEAE
ncbi:AraC family transcriptional regulator [Paenibacillus oleatilyticus]|uniref:AraC family transcriptional regulator n=1 Tax=Paenibacillus oleatilyticus TaxID=2594886 RepID=UPI001C2008ED|nr:AraC family transcriptional regulator [Paenibacillus oleatilyticus]MBU7315626.1 AraC family transcriptional regulator [Paenibacillus oleatilyticus]